MGWTDLRNTLFLRGQLKSHQPETNLSGQLIGLSFQKKVLSDMLITYNYLNYNFKL